MAIRSLQLLLLAAVLLFCLATLINGDTLEELPRSFLPPPPSDKYLDGSFTNLLEPILAHLGFQQLSTAADGIKDIYTVANWNGPFTIFAPSDAAFGSCSSCSHTQILGEHTVPGLYTTADLLDLDAGSTIETMNPGYCIAVTSINSVWENSTSVFIAGVKITQPNLFNNGLLIVHGLEGSVSPLSPLSCSVTPLSLPPQNFQSEFFAATVNPRFVMDAMLQDAIVRLRNHGCGVLALAMKSKYEQLMALQNATIFAVEDNLIFSEVRNYAGNIRFHIVPNRFIAEEELFTLPLGAKMETMERDQYLVVTSAGGPSKIQINHVGIKIPELVKNLKVVVHNLFLPLPHILVEPPSSDDSSVVDGGSNVPESERKQAAVPVPAPAPAPRRSTQRTLTVPPSTQTAPKTVPSTPARPYATVAEEGACREGPIEDSSIVDGGSNVPELAPKQMAIPAPVPVPEPHRSTQTALAVPPSTQTAPPTVPPPPVLPYEPVAEEGACREGPITIDDIHGL